MPPPTKSSKDEEKPERHTAKLPRRDASQKHTPLCTCKLIGKVSASSPCQSDPNISCRNIDVSLEKFDNADCLRFNEYPKRHLRCLSAWFTKDFRARYHGQIRNCRHDSLSSNFLRPRRLCRHLSSFLPRRNVLRVFTSKNQQLVGLLST